MNKKGLFITFEGLDGSGKSTQIDKLKERLTSSGFEVLLTREPGGTTIGEKIRELILDPANDSMDDMTEAYLYASSRAQLVRETILPALEEGKIVICDRFVDSSIAYQGYGRMMGDVIRQINLHAVEGCMPDLTFLLRVTPSGGMSRINSRELDRIELAGKDFHQRTFEGYEAVAANEPDRVKVIDAAGTIEDIHEQIFSYVKELLSLE